MNPQRSKVRIEIFQRYVIREKILSVWVENLMSNTFGSNMRREDDPCCSGLK